MPPKQLGRLLSAPRRRSPLVLPSAPARHLSCAPLAHPLAGRQATPTSSPGYGQPLPSSHSHLLAPGELTAGISADEYEGRRKALMAGLEEGSVVVVAGGRIKYLSGAIL